MSKVHFKYKFEFNEEDMNWDIKIKTDKHILGEWIPAKKFVEKIMKLEIATNSGDEYSELTKQKNDLYESFHLAKGYVSSFSTFSKAEEAFDKLMKYYARYANELKRQKDKQKGGVVTDEDIFLHTL